MSPAEKPGMRKHLLTNSLAKPSCNVKAIFETYELLIYGDIRYVILRYLLYS